MSDYSLRTTTLVTLPTFLKGASRVVDLYGKLDEYDYRNDADSFALKTDWENVGGSIYISIDCYDQEKAQKAFKSLARTAR